MNKKIIKFRNYLVKEILEGRKDVTWRLFDDKNLQVGDRLILQNWNTGENFAEAEITDVREKKIGEIKKSDFEGHEKFKNKEEMLETYRKYYGDRLTPDTIVKIIKFRLMIK